MANNQYVNKVVFGNETLIDLSSDTIAAGDILSGVTAHDASGAPITGTIPFYSGLDITKTFTQNAFGSTEYVLGLNMPQGHYIAGTLKFPKIQIPIPTSGRTNTITIEVPNGTTTPDPNEETDWIPIKFTVDSNGNSEVTEDVTMATGVSF